MLTEPTSSASLVPDVGGYTPYIASPSQRAAIEARLGPVLVLAGPGAGKTFCLIERIRFLIETYGHDPARILAFTYTNRAAEEIASRLKKLGPRADGVRRGTIHTFCARLLREFGDQVGVDRRFGIADEAYQREVLRRLRIHPRKHKKFLGLFTAHRFNGEPLFPVTRAAFEDYNRLLAKARVLDFDTLLLKAAELLESTPAAAIVRERWTALLVDEFQDLNSAEYRVLHALACEHRNVFAVGDHEQSIFSWTGAYKNVFSDFMGHFGITQANTFALQENHRCPREVFDPARVLLAKNPTWFSEYLPATPGRDSGYPVEVRGFDDDVAEIAWIVDDLRRDFAENGHVWSDVGLLYRRHSIGECIEAAFLNAGIPCRLAVGRALSDDPAVAYAIAALRVITFPDDDVCRHRFFSLVLPRALFDEARAQAESRKRELTWQLRYMLARRPLGEGTRRQIRRALGAWRNLAAVGRQHETLISLVQELVSQRIRRLHSVLDERADDLSDPAQSEEAVQLANRLRTARGADRIIWLPRIGGIEIPLKGMLIDCGFRRVNLGGSRPPEAECVTFEDAPSLGLPLGLFKALQLLEIGDFSPGSRDFTAVDLETTDSDAKVADIVEIAAVRVRDGMIVDTFTSLVKPNGPIPAAATEIHEITDADVESALPFEAVWPKFRAFCGDDVVVAHNGYEFDFMVMRRMCDACGRSFDLCTYDTLPLARDLCRTSRSLPSLAEQFDIDPGRAHRATPDALTLAKVFMKLDEAKICRARKTALVDHLDQLALALALCDENSLCEEARVFLDVGHVFPFFKRSTCLEAYERERAGDESTLTVNDAIERLGGAKLMENIRREKRPDERFLGTMLKLRRLMEQIPDGPRQEQIDALLERVFLSKYDPREPDSGRVNLLTLHSTKGLQFSRVYIVGAEDVELPGGHPIDGPTSDEIEEARRLLYVGMTRAKDRLVITRVETRQGKRTGGHRFLDEMALLPYSV